MPEIPVSTRTMKPTIISLLAISGALIAPGAESAAPADQLIADFEADT
jgi:hypothetical protein